MICEYCKQRHASVTITQVQNGTKLERHYCDVCATQFHPFHFDVQDEPISLHQLVSNWFGSVAKPSQVEPKKQPLSCPTCNFTYRQFLKVGKFGCPTCYETFREQIPSMLQRIQADVKHVGVQQEANETLKIHEQIVQLKEQMQQAIAQEQFEEAAKLRDEVRALQQTLTTDEVNES